MNKFDHILMSICVVILFLGIPTLGYHMSQPRPSNSCSFWQYGDLIETVGGRMAEVIDCRTQDNVINTETYVTVQWIDDGKTKELHWSRFKEERKS